MVPSTAILLLQTKRTWSGSVVLAQLEDFEFADSVDRLRSALQLAASRTEREAKSSNSDALAKPNRCASLYEIAELFRPAVLEGIAPTLRLRGKHAACLESRTP
jgi:hypothetical protein